MKRFTISVCLSAAVFVGCNGLSIRSQSPEDTAVKAADDRKLVGDVATPFGMFPIQVESVALVNGLPGTGSDPAPSPQRSRLLTEMTRKGVENPNQVLASPTTELVLVRGLLRPGIQKGDRFDLEVRVPTRHENGGLRGGWLMETRLTQMAQGGGFLHEGAPAAVAEGPILVDPTVEGRQDKVLLSRGRVLGGAISTIDRPIGLVLKQSYRNIAVSSMVGAAINNRFHTFDKGIKVGVAKPKTDQYIELKIHPRYKDNLERYVRVLRALPIKESSSEQLTRLQVLERNLLDPISSASAAVRLEAVGKEAIPVLKKGLASNNVEVRFYAAEALAYLDEKSAAAPLAEISRNEPAFRAYSLAALGAMEEYESVDALKTLLSAPSAETRYGAFRALWTMNPSDPFLRDERITPQFHYHVLKSEGAPMVHFTRNARPEVVLFGADQKLVPPVSLEAGPRILVNSIDAEHLAVSRYAPGEPDQKQIISMSVDEMIRAIADMGGTYPDVVQALQQAKSSKSLDGRLEIEALPKGGREFERAAAPTAETDASLDPETKDAVPADGLAPAEAADRDALTDARKASSEPAKGEEQAENGENAEEAAAQPSLWRRFLGKMAVN